MKILIVSGKSDLPEAHIYKNLSLKGHKVHLLGDPTSPYRDIMLEGGVIISDIKFNGRIDPFNIYKLYIKIKNENYDIVHTYSNNALSNVLFAILFHKSKVCTYRGTSGHLSRLDPVSWLTYLNPRLDMILCVSKAVENYMLSLKIPQKKLLTIYKGHNVEWYSKQKADKSILGIEKDEFVVSCVANMRPVKGVDILIESIKYIPKELKIKFVLVGEVKGIDPDKLDSDTKNKIIFTGYRKDAIAIIGLSNTFVMPSRGREGLPKAVIEAMSQSVTPIVTNVGGMPELVIHEESGLVVPPESPEDLAKAIQRLYFDRELNTKLGANAKERVRRSFNVEHTVDRYIQMYEELVKV